MSTFIVLFFLLLSLEAQPRRQISDRVNDISAETASERWAKFMMSKQADNFYFCFELKHLPKRAKASTYLGEMLAKRINHTYHTRLCFADSQGNRYDYLFILEELSGKSQVYSYDFETNATRQLNPEDLLQPLAKGLIYTPLDVLMDYKYWEAKYQRAGRISQAVYFFKLKSPYAWLGDVEIALSREFNSPEQTQFFSPKGELLRTFSLGSVKKIDDYWIVKTAEIKDEVSGDKDKFSITAANLKESLDANLFKKESLGKDIERILLEDIR
ncbi:MAG: outer membrane lipoprotein-sorting protein [Opitutales bacterium]